MDVQIAVLLALLGGSGEPEPIFESEPPKSLWRHEMTITDNGVRWVELFFQPSESPLHVCRTGVMTVYLGKGQRVTKDGECNREPCLAESLTYVARRSANDPPCSKLGLDRYIWLRNLIVDEEIVRLDGILRCVQRAAAQKIFAGRVAQDCPVIRVVEATGSVTFQEATPEAKREFVELARKHVHSIRIKHEGAQTPLFYVAEFCEDLGGCGRYVELRSSASNNELLVSL